MIFIGMIFQYDASQDAGIIMLSDGEKKEFTSNDWVDTLNQPAVGQKVSYETNENSVQIKVATQEDMNKSLADQEKKEASTDNAKQLTSVDDYLEYFTSMGFKLVKDDKSDVSRTLALRSYSMDEFSEVNIKEANSKVTIEHTVNGKVVQMNYTVA